PEEAAERPSRRTHHRGRPLSAGMTGGKSESMYRYIVKRILLVIPTLVGAAALVVLLMRLIPGDICVVRLGSGGGPFVGPAGAPRHPPPRPPLPPPARPRPPDLPAVRRFRMGLLSRRFRDLHVVGQAGRL